jgi:F0F1-type ATP synthase membrane subunit b/b'
VREARQKVFQDLENRRQRATRLRSEAVNQSRARAQEQVKQARELLEQDKREAMAKLQLEAGRLATDIVRAVLRPVAAPSQVGG